MSANFIRTCLLLQLYCAVLGCDLGGAYEKKFQETLQTSAKQAVFESNLHATTTDVTDAKGQPIGVKLRLPKVFDQNKRQMPQIAIPGAPAGLGSTIAYGGTLDDPSGQKLPCVVTFAPTPKGDPKSDAFQKMFTKGSPIMLPNAKLEDAAFTSPAGQAVSLKRLRMEMPPFPLGKDGAKVESRMDMYQIDAGNNTIVVGWMVPKSLTATMDPVIEASMGTLEISGAPPAPAGGQAAPAGKATPGCM